MLYVIKIEFEFLIKILVCFYLFLFYVVYYRNVEIFFI